MVLRRSCRSASRETPAEFLRVVDVNLNGYEYRNTGGVMGGQSMISVSAAIRKATGLTSWDPIGVTLTLNDAP